MLAWLTAIATIGTVGLATGCGSEETSSEPESSVVKIQENTAEDASEADAADDGSVEAYAEALAGSLWLGMDAEYHCYAMGFNNEEIVFEADDGSSVSGYWGVTAEDPTIYIFDDAELQLTNDGESIVYTQVSEEDANTVVDYLYSAIGLEESAE